MTDAEIVARIREGDAEAYTLLVDRYRSAAYGLAYHYLRSVEDARDLAQEALVQAYLRLLTPGTHFYRVDDNRPHFKTHMKNRVVDPGVLEPGWTEPRRLSAIF